MKKLCLLLTCSLLVWVANAQRYSFSHSERPYIEITNPDVSDTVLNNYLDFLPPYSFTLFGEQTDGTWNAGTSAGYLIAGNATYGFAMDPMMGTRFRKIEGISQVSVKTISTANDTIMVVQWKNIGLYGHASTDFLNFQVRLYLRSKLIEFHYGPSHFTTIANDSAFMNPTNKGPEVLMVMLTADFNNFIEFNSISGNPVSPIYSVNYARLNSLPATNQLFSFTSKPKVGVTDLNTNEKLVTLFPNPTNDGYFSIKSEELEISFIKIYNLLGQLQESNILTIPGFTVNVNLPKPKQPYFIEIGLVNGTKVQRKIITN